MKKEVRDYIKAVKRKAREEELAKHGKIISIRPARIKKSKKVYKRDKRFTERYYL